MSSRTRTISDADIAALRAIRSVIADAAEHPARAAAIEALDRVTAPTCGEGSVTHRHGPTPDTWTWCECEKQRAEQDVDGKVILRRSTLLDFIERAWSVLHPGERFVRGLYLEVLCEQIERGARPIDPEIEAARIGDALANHLESLGPAVSDPAKSLRFTELFSAVPLGDRVEVPLPGPVVTGPQLGHRDPKAEHGLFVADVPHDVTGRHEDGCHCVKCCSKKLDEISRLEIDVDCAGAPIAPPVPELGPASGSGAKPGATAAESRRCYGCSEGIPESQGFLVQTIVDGQPVQRPTCGRQGCVSAASLSQRHAHHQVFDGKLCVDLVPPGLPEMRIPRCLVCPRCGYQDVIKADPGCDRCGAWMQRVVGTATGS